MSKKQQKVTHCQRHAERKIHSLKYFDYKHERLKRSELGIQLKKLEKKQNKMKESQRKASVKIKSELKKLENQN